MQVILEQGSHTRCPHTTCGPRASIKINILLQYWDILHIYFTWMIFTWKFKGYFFHFFNAARKTLFWDPESIWVWDPCPRASNKLRRMLKHFCSLTIYSKSCTYLVTSEDSLSLKIIVFLKATMKCRERGTLESCWAIYSIEGRSPAFSEPLTKKLEFFRPFERSSTRSLTRVWVIVIVCITNLDKLSLVKFGNGGLNKARTYFY